MSSVTIPALASGIYRFPVEVAAEIAMEVLLDVDFDVALVNMEQDKHIATRARTPASVERNLTFFSNKRISILTKDHNHTIECATSQACLTDTYTPL